MAPSHTHQNHLVQQNYRLNAQNVPNKSTNYPPRNQAPYHHPNTHQILERGQ